MATKGWNCWDIATPSGGGLGSCRLTLNIFSKVLQEMEGTSDPDGEGPHQTQGPIKGGRHGGVGGGPGPQSSKRRLGPSMEVPGAKVRATA
jgi:hypothetical protein